VIVRRLALHKLPAEKLPGFEAGVQDDGSEQ
jgi:hypothetical protein